MRGVFIRSVFDAWASDAEGWWYSSSIKGVQSIAGVVQAASSSSLETRVETEPARSYDG
jgi:hypothetical protein